MKIFSNNDRIAKRIAQSGYCSRRAAEKLIISGKVKLNGSKILKCNINVNSKDVIHIDDKLLTRKDKTRVWLYYKRRGFLVTNNDIKGRPNIFDDIKNKIKYRVISVGRLDFNSEGLIILTNNGDLARKLELPKNNIERTYKVKIYGDLKYGVIDILKKGISINGLTYKTIKLEIGEKKNKNVWIKMSLIEGKNREIRKIMSHFGCKVNRLIRVGYGPFILKDLKPGQINEINNNALNKILNRLDF